LGKPFGGNEAQLRSVSFDVQRQMAAQKAVQKRVENLTASSFNPFSVFGSSRLT
jgi:hypothetical protein